jgi:cytochrome c
MSGKSIELKAGYIRKKELGEFMRLLHVTTATMVATLVSTAALASKELAQKSACLACHAADKKLVGPAYQDVVKKYAGQKDAEATLANSIKAGGSGKWGPVPMPAQTALTDADARALAVWILTGAK